MQQRLIILCIAYGTNEYSMKKIEQIIYDNGYAGPENLKPVALILLPDLPLDRGNQFTVFDNF